MRIASHGHASTHRPHTTQRSSSISNTAGRFSMPLLSRLLGDDRDAVRRAHGRAAHARDAAHRAVVAQHQAVQAAEPLRIRDLLLRVLDGLDLVAASCSSTGAPALRAAPRLRSGRNKLRAKCLSVMPRPFAVAARNVVVLAARAARPGSCAPAGWRRDREDLRARRVGFVVVVVIVCCGHRQPPQVKMQLDQRRDHDVGERRAAAAASSRGSSADRRGTAAASSGPAAGTATAARPWRRTRTNCSSTTTPCGSGSTSRRSRRG